MPLLSGTGEGSSKHQDLVAEVADLLGFDPKLRPSRVDVSPELDIAIQPSVDDALRPADDCRTNLYLGMENLRRRSLVPVGKRRKKRLGYLHVLLRHRPRSIPRFIALSMQST